MMPRQISNNYRRLRGALNLNLQSASSSWIAQNLKTETPSFSETSVIILQKIWRHIPKDLNLHIPPCENLKSRDSYW
jgi:hypothetical protein